MRPKVLLVGKDGYLASSRGMLMQSEGYSVSEAYRLDQLTTEACADVALVVLCHTFSLDEKRQAIEAIRRAAPRAMMLNLCVEDRGELPEHAHASVIDGPTQLILAARDLVRRWKNRLQ